MAIATTGSFVRYVGNGVTLQYAFANKIFAAADLVVTLIDPAGNLYTFVNFTNVALGLNYAVQGVDVDTGCSVLFSNPITNGWIVDIRTLIPELQSTSIKNQGSFLPELHEEAFDRVTRLIQDLLRLTYTFGLHGPDNEATPWPALPASSVRKGYGLLFDAITGLPGIGFLSAQNVTIGLLAPLLGLGQTLAEQNQGVVPTNFAYRPGSLLRYGADPTGVADSHTALLNACKCNSDVFDDYPGGGTYSFDSETVIPAYPITIRGQARWIGSAVAPLTGTIFKLRTAAGAGAACLRFNAFTTGVHIQGIGFTFQTYTTGQIAIRASNDFRAAIIEGCGILGSQAAGTTVIGIQLDSAAIFSGDVVIRDNYISAVLRGVWLQGSCTTVKIYGNEFYGYTNASGVNGDGVRMDYPVLEPVLSINYFEGWTNGVNSNGAAQVRQIGNDFEVCTNGYNWVQTTYSTITNQSIGDHGVGGVASGYANLDASQINGVGRLLFLATGGQIQSTRGFQEGDGVGSNLRAQLLGYPTDVAFAAGNFTAQTGTWTPGAGNQTTYSWTLVGKMMTVWFCIAGGALSGTPTWVGIAIPAGKTARNTVQNSTGIANNGVWSASAAQVNAAGAVIQVFANVAGTATFGTSAAAEGQISFEIN